MGRIPSKKDLKKFLMKPYERDIGFLAIIFTGYLLLISDISQESYLVSLISMNFTIGSLVIAILSLSDSLADRGVIFLKYSSRLFIGSAVLLFYLTVIILPGTSGGMDIFFKNFLAVVCSGVFSLGVFFLILGVNSMKSEVDMSLIEAYLYDSPYEENKST